MTQLRLRRPRRHGAALVETTAVVIVFLLLLFGVLEYCRFIFLRQLVDNAAREGARFAVVSTSYPTLSADTQAVVNARMAGFSSAVKNWSVQVYHADSNGNKVYGYQSDSGGNYVASTSGTKTYIQFDSNTNQNYVVDTANNNAKVYFTLNTTANTINDTSGNFATWAGQNNLGNVDGPANATFGQYIAVQIDCDYNPIAPTLLMANQTVHITTKALMYSEAN
jgi:Flp pilus assembly protein TadG